MIILITSTPLGEAPEEIRSAWIGLAIPVCRGWERAVDTIGFGALTGPKSTFGAIWHLILGRGVRQRGYGVHGATAIALLEGFNADAAEWWRVHTPRLLQSNRRMMFDELCCIALAGNVRRADASRSAGESATASESRHNKYDDATWHSGGNFPSDLPPEAGATHTGMFLAWAVLKGLGGSLLTDESPEELEQLLNREITPGAYFLAASDGKLIEQDLSAEGNEFALDYFEFKIGPFFKDYCHTVAAGCPSAYHVPDTWETFDALKPVLDARFVEWKGTAE